MTSSPYKEIDQFSKTKTCQCSKTTQISFQKLKLANGSKTIPSTPQRTALFLGFWEDLQNDTTAGLRVANWADPLFLGSYAWYQTNPTVWKLCLQKLFSNELLRPRVKQNLWCVCLSPCSKKIIKLKMQFFKKKSINHDNVLSTYIKDRFL